VVGEKLFCNGKKMFDLERFQKEKLTFRYKNENLKVGFTLNKYLL
jgi:hypothetical protein